MKKRKGRGKGCLVLLALLSAWLALPAMAQAADVSLFSPRRFSLAAQVGVDYWRQTNEDNGTQTKPAVKLVPSYMLWSKPDHVGGSIALNAPVKYGLTGDHPAEFGVYLSICVWSGNDQP